MSAWTFLDVLDAAPAPRETGDRPAVARLAAEDGVELIAFTFRPGQSLPEHRAAHPITVQCLSGRLDFGVGDERAELVPGRILHLQAGVTHRVDCPGPEASVLLLSMLTGRR